MDGESLLRDASGRILLPSPVRLPDAPRAAGLLGFIGAALAALVLVAFGATTPYTVTSPPIWPALIVAFVVTEVAAMVAEALSGRARQPRRELTLTFGLVFVAPLTLVLADLAATATAATLLRRDTPRRTGVLMAGRAAETMVALGVFLALSPPSAVSEPVTWVALSAGLVAAAGVRHQVQKGADRLCGLGPEWSGTGTLWLEDPLNLSVSAVVAVGAVIATDVHPAGIALGVAGLVAIVGWELMRAERVHHITDVAMYAAKSSGETFRPFEGQMERQLTRRLGLATDLRAALAGGSLGVMFQPKVRFDDGSLVGAEALLRWHHPTLGWVPAPEIIDVAQHAGVDHEVTKVVLRRSTEMAQRLRGSGIDVPVAVNLSVSDLGNTYLPHQLTELLEAAGLQPNALMAEIPESGLLTPEIEARDVIPALTELGVAMSIDDFGTGFSSLSRLGRYAVAEIKIDKSFIERMILEPGDAVIVESIIDLGHRLGLVVVAEGVETMEVWSALQVMGCDVAQGYFIMRPLDEPAFVAWARHWRADPKPREQLESPWRQLDLREPPLRSVTPPVG